VRSGAGREEALGGLRPAGISIDVVTPLCHGREREEEGERRKREKE
jgi:hypothetical protein